MPRCIAVLPSNASSQRTKLGRVGALEGWAEGHSTGGTSLWRGVTDPDDGEPQMTAAIPTIRELFDIPEQIRKGDFVHKLGEGIANPSESPLRHDRSGGASIGSGGASW